MQFRYVILHEEDKPVGIAYFQVINITKNEINTDALAERMGGLLPRHLINSLNINLLICGNAFATGENGYFFKEDVNNGEVRIETTVKHIEKAAQRRRHQKYPLVLSRNFGHRTLKKPNTIQTIAILVFP